jgi:LacI family transcriptional regulator
MDLSVNTPHPAAADDVPPATDEASEATPSAAPSGRSMRHVALLIETSGSYGRALLRGVARYNRERGNWSTYFQPHGLGAAPPQWLKTWEGDGVLARVENKQMADSLRKTGVPVVNLRGTDPGLKFPYVGLDHAKIARLAATHLMERGIKHFGFCGKARGIHPGLDLRCDEFERAVGEAGFTCSEFPARAGDVDWELEQARIAAWIQTLPRPVGVMACNDERGLQLLDACRRAGARVPDDVAVIGADDDEHLCELSIPPMTSVDVNGEQIGYAAAELLDKLMSGRKAPPTPTLLAPRGIVTRRSTDVLASEDPVVNRAVAFIRENRGRGLQVTDVIAHLKMSRASLEPRIKKVLGRTIHQEIQRVQLDRVKELLVGSPMPIKQIAREGGFSCVQYLTRVFRTATGETPARYRSSRRR